MLITSAVEIELAGRPVDETAPHQMIHLPSSDGSLFHSQGVGFTRLEIYSVTIAAEDVMKLDIEKKRIEKEDVGRFEGTGSC